MKPKPPFFRGRRHVVGKLRSSAFRRGFDHPSTFIHSLGAKNKIGYCRGTVVLHTQYPARVTNWIRDRVRQGHFRVLFIRGLHNVADFFTKPLPVARHRVLAPFIAADPTDTIVNLTISSILLLLRTDSTLHHAGVFILM